VTLTGLQQRLQVEEMEEVTDAQWNKLSKPTKGAGNNNTAAASANPVDVPPTATFDFDSTCGWADTAIDITKPGGSR